MITCTIRNGCSFSARLGAIGRLLMIYAREIFTLFLMSPAQIMPLWENGGGIQRRPTSFPLPNSSYGSSKVGEIAVLRKFLCQERERRNQNFSKSFLYLIQGILIRRESWWLCMDSKAHSLDLRLHGAEIKRWKALKNTYLWLISDLLVFANSRVNN